jgi:hypothetical protein
VEQAFQLSDVDGPGTDDDLFPLVDHEVQDVSRLQLEQVADRLGDGDLTLAGHGGCGHVPYLM